MSFSGDRAPKGYGVAQLQNFTPKQMTLLSQMIDHLGPEGFLSRLAGGDQSFFDEVEAPAKKQFAGAIGNLGSRFAGMGTGGLRSSGFQNSANQASMDFAERLQSNRLNMRQQAVRDLMSSGNALLQQRPYEKGFYQKPQKQGMGGVIGAGIGGLGGFLAGGPMGALSGASLGYNIGSGGKGGSQNFKDIFGGGENGLDWLVNNLPGGMG